MWRVAPAIRNVAGIGWMLGTQPPMQAKSVARGEQQSADEELGLRVLALDSGHHPAAIGGGDDINHGFCPDDVAGRALRWPAYFTSGMLVAGAE